MCCSASMMVSTSYSALLLMISGSGGSSVGWPSSKGMYGSSQLILKTGQIWRWTERFSWYALLFIIFVMVYRPIFFWSNFWLGLLVQISIIHNQILSPTAKVISFLYLLYCFAMANCIYSSAVFNVLNSFCILVAYAAAVGSSRGPSLSSFIMTDLRWYPWFAKKGKSPAEECFELL